MEIFTIRPIPETAAVVVFKVEKPSNQMMHLYTFIVTS